MMEWKEPWTVSILVTLSIWPHHPRSGFLVLKRKSCTQVEQAESGRDGDTSASDTPQLILELFLTESRVCHTQLQGALVDHVPSWHKLTLRACPRPNILWYSLYWQSLISLPRKGKLGCRYSSLQNLSVFEILPGILNQVVKGQPWPLLTGAEGVRKDQAPSWVVRAGGGPKAVWRPYHKQRVTGQEIPHRDP